MILRYWKFAGTIVCGSTALFALSGCWSREPMPAAQVQPGATISEPSGTSYQSQSTDWATVPPGTSATYYGAQGEPAGAQPMQKPMAPIDNASSDWQRGVDNRPKVHEPSGSAKHAKTKSLQSWQVVTSSGLWQSGISQGTLGPDATISNGWIPGDSNPDIVQEPSGANSKNNGWLAPSYDSTSPQQ